MTKPLICVICTRRETRSGMVCDPDRLRLARTLDEIVELYALLPAQMVPGQAYGQRLGKPSPPWEAPLPLKVDPLDLTMPARTASVTDEYGDQDGEVSVASTLDSWVQDWRSSVVQGPDPRPTVVELAGWLRTWLEAACQDHPAIDEFATDMFALRATLRRHCGTNEVKPELLDAECSRCDQRAMYRLPGEDRVECGGCGRRMTEDEYRRWCGLLVADARERMTA